MARIYNYEVVVFTGKKSDFTLQDDIGYKFVAPYWKPGY